MSAGAVRAEGMTLDEIGQAFGLTRERVRQIEQKALRKLRHAFRRELGEEEIVDLLSDPGRSASSRRGPWR